jgi:trk system potassium uptake protein TrkH
VRDRFATLHTVLHWLGGLLLALAAALLPPLAIGLAIEDLAVEQQAWAFGAPALLAAGLGLGLRRAFHRSAPGSVQAMLICGLGWVLLAAIGAIPYVVLVDASYVDALFETISGFTTTGITMFAGLEKFPRSLLLWRAFTQWVGGLGILTFFLAIVSREGIVHDIFGAESHKIASHRPVPGLTRTVRLLWSIYVGITVAIGLGLLASGTSIFDAICHAFTTISTGGFSPYDASIAHFREDPSVNSKLLEYVVILGMLAGGTSFVVHYRLLRGEVAALWDRTEARWWAGLLGLFLVALLIERGVVFDAFSGELGFETVEGEFRTALFQMLAILTTTGFATEDIAGPYYGAAAQQLFLLMMLIGGCVGSTGGGFKVLRIALLTKLFGRQVFRARAPRGAEAGVVLDGALVPDAELEKVAGLFFAWLGLLLVGGVVTAMFSSHGAHASISGMFSALNNIGPCYISVEEMGRLHPVVKVTYMVGMLAGRLEILPIALLLSPKAWRA